PVPSSRFPVPCSQFPVPDDGANYPLAIRLGMGTLADAKSSLTPQIWSFTAFGDEPGSVDPRSSRRGPNVYHPRSAELQTRQGPSADRPVPRALGRIEGHGSPTATP